MMSSLSLALCLAPSLPRSLSLSLGGTLRVVPLNSERRPPVPHGGVRPFHQKSICLTQSTLGPYVVHIWSRNTLELRGDETFELHRVATPPSRASELI